jgi:hypothetical protein
VSIERLLSVDIVTCLRATVDRIVGHDSIDEGCIIRKILLSNEHGPSADGNSRALIGTSYGRFRSNDTVNTVTCCTGWFAGFVSAIVPDILHHRSLS